MLSVAYQATVVLVESPVTPREAPPVRARGLYVTPIRSPFIDRVRSTDGVEAPITVGSTIVVEGSRLDSPSVQVRVGTVTVDPAAGQVTDTAITLPVPAGVQAGILGVQVIQPFLMGEPPVAHRGVESNAAPFVLRPTLTGPVTLANGAGGAVDATVPLDPPVGKAQRVVLLLNEFSAPQTRAPLAYSFEAPSRNLPASPATQATITFPTLGVEAHEYLVRVRVDGAESVLGVDGSGRLATPRVTFP